MVDEAHVTTFAVHPRYRRRQIGERLLLALIDLAVDRHAREATLEVRLSNLAARRLYEKYGFRPVGIRPALLQRQPGRRADHDHGAARRGADARPDRDPPRGARRRPAAGRRPDDADAPGDAGQPPPTAP